MTHPVPSRRYDQFIKVYEAKVTAAQAAIEAVEKLEQPYNLVVEALEEASLPNNCTIDASGSCITIEIEAIPSDFAAVFNSLAIKIGLRLFGANHHKNGVPACTQGGSWRQLTWIWHCDNFSIYLIVTVPLDEGLVDLEVKRVAYPTTSYRYEFHPRTAKWWLLAPAHLDMALDHVEDGNTRIDAALKEREQE
jgi:hypothetical protein